MAGIAGKVTFDRDRHISTDVVRAMTAALAHRGRGRTRYHTGPGVGIGHREGRAVSTGDSRVMTNETDWVFAAADSALTNAGDLEAQLRAHGHFFYTKTDSEIIAHAYEQWGEDFVNRLRGAFAFAVWDARRERLVLGRDRLGMKPLFYALLPASLVFASEIKALLEDGDVPRTYDPAAVGQYLAFNYVLAPSTIFSHVFKLPAGHLATVEHGQARVTEYWDLGSQFGGAEARLKPRDAIERAAIWMRDAARADASVDRSAVVLLSGGAGSAVLAAQIGAARSEPVETVTFAIDRPPFEESQIARTVAKRLGTTHHTDLVTPRVRDLLPRLAWHLDEPNGDPTAIATYWMAAAARQHADTAICGHGGSQAFGSDGRRGEIEDAYAASLDLFALTARFLERAMPVGISTGRRLSEMLRTPADAWAGRQVIGASRRLLTPEFREAASDTNPLSGLTALYSHSPFRHALDRARYMNLKSVVADKVLAQIDRMSAAAGIEVRMPLLDHYVVDAAGAIPLVTRLGDRSPDQVLRAFLPGEVRNALWENKRGWIRTRPASNFGAQASSWLRGPLAPMASDLLLGGRLRHRRIVDTKAVTKLWQQHLTGRRDHYRQLWSLLMLELWFEQFVDTTSRVSRIAA